MDDDGALPPGTNTNLHRMVTNLSGQARVCKSILMYLLNYGQIYRKSTKMNFSRANLLSRNIFADSNAGAIDMSVTWTRGPDFNLWTFSVIILLNSNMESSTILRFRGNILRRALSFSSIRTIAKTSYRTKIATKTSQRSLNLGPNSRIADLMGIAGGVLRSMVLTIPKFLSPCNFHLVGTSVERRG